MTLELEGNLSLERAHTRRWVSIIAVIIPVAAFVLLAAWFVRAYVVPPTVAIPSPVTLADAPPPPPAIPRRAQVEAPPPSLTASAEPAKETPVSAAALPMIATLAAAPPSMARVPPASAEPADSPSATASITVAEPTAEQQLSEPLAGPIPLPRSKPHGRFAAISGVVVVPLPRPRPIEAAPEPDLPVLDRHGVN